MLRLAAAVVPGVVFGSWFAFEVSTGAAAGATKMTAVVAAEVAAVAAMVNAARRHRGGWPTGFGRRPPAI